jgi:hypothetical protein
MANKEVLDQINAERVRRATDLDTLDGYAVLSLLRDSWAREAELLATSQKKGWQSEAKTLGSAVVLLKLEITALEKRSATKPPAREPVTGPSPSWTKPTLLNKLVTDAQESGLGKLVAGASRCPNPGDHEPHTWTGPRDPATGSDRWQCSPEPTLLVGVALGMDDSVAAYLSGATHELGEPLTREEALDRTQQAIDDLTVLVSRGGLPVRHEDGETMSITHHTSNGTPYTVSGQTAVIERLGTHLATESTVHQEVDASMPDVHAEPLAPMFTDSSAPTSRTRPVPPSMVGKDPATWAELARPVEPLCVPDHMSPSQLSTLDTCPAQARLSRYEGMPGIPLWGAVGGTAFHRAVEEIERDVAVNGWECLADYLAPKGPNVWNKAFHAVVAEEIAKSGVPMTDWYASASGKENYSWWLVEGGEMVKRYVTYRVRHDDGRKVLILPDGRPAIELELTLDLGALPVKVILDIVWQLPDGSLEIWDHKTRRDYMGPIVDTIQLGTQGHALDQVMTDQLPDIAHWQLGAPSQITARYFDARKGQLTDAFDPLDRHPIEELEMRYADGDDKRRNRPAIPVRSNLCKACPVAYLCPVGSKL